MRELFINLIVLSSLGTFIYAAWLYWSNVRKGADPKKEAMRAFMLAIGPPLIGIGMYYAI